MDRLQLRADPSPATTGTSTPKPTSQSDSRLPNGTVAGIVVGVAVGLALISSLITFLIMHRKQSSRGKRLSKNPPDQMSLESVSTRRNRGASKTKETSQIDPAQHHPAMYENFLPRSADDRDVKTRASTLLDQIDFHVENFYKSRRASRDSLKEASVQIFDSGLLPKPLFSVLLESKNVVPILKHTLAFVITDAISATAHARWSLLPDDFVLLPRAVASVRPKATESEKPGMLPEPSLIPITGICTLIAHRLCAVFLPLACIDGLFTTRRFTRQVIHEAKESENPRVGPRFLQHLCCLDVG